MKTGWYNDQQLEHNFRLFLSSNAYGEELQIIKKNSLIYSHKQVQDIGETRNKVKTIPEEVTSGVNLSVT